MRTGSVKKYVIPNIPYLFVLWACLKLGTAYRLAAGADFPHKLMGLGQTVGPAFANLAPGLDPFDWLVGIVGAVGFRLLIYFKSKNAKKFRRDEEFGSARWGGPKDIAPFVDPVFENNVILTGTEFLTMNTRPKNPANARNLNACVIGSSGSGKTRFWLTPQLLQASAKKKGGCSFVVVDPKGGVLSQVGAFLQRRGYRIKVFNSIDFSQSMHYNPLAYIRNEADILKFVDTLIANTKGEGKEGDPFWTKAETLLYCALIAYIIFEGPAEDRNTIEPGQGFSEEGGFVTRDLLYDENTNKQFITVQTSGGATFYFVIDYDKPVDEEGEQYETYFLNVVDEADLLAAAEAAGVEQAVCSCSEKCEVGAVNTECAVCSVNMGKCVGVAPEPAETEEPAEEPETGGSMGRLLLILAVAGIGGGAAFYFKVIRPKQQQAAEPEEDYGEEDYEDDGPPWDEDENSEEDEE